MPPWLLRQVQTQSGSTSYQVHNGASTSQRLKRSAVAARVETVIKVLVPGDPATPALAVEHAAEVVMLDAPTAGGGQRRRGNTASTTLGRRRRNRCRTHAWTQGPTRARAVRRNRETDLGIPGDADHVSRRNHVVVWEESVDLGIVFWGHALSPTITRTRREVGHAAGRLKIRRTCMRGRGGSGQGVRFALPRPV